jgi:hypothetical protein
MSQRVQEEQRRLLVERFLAADLSVDEWSKRNGIYKSTMYKWLAEFAEREPELFGGSNNIVDRNKRRWVELTRKNIAASTALTKAQEPGVVLVDTLGLPSASTGHDSKPTHPLPSISIHVKGMEITVPPGTARSDIASVLCVVSGL